MNRCQLDDCPDDAVDQLVFLNPNIGPYWACQVHGRQMCDTSLSEFPNIRRVAPETERPSVR